MTENNIKAYWNYFRALTEQLKRTEQYVDHMVGSDGSEKNGKVYSNEFAKILMLAASEFEVVGKALCAECGAIMNQRVDIKVISKEILNKFPKIVDTIICTPYKTYKPLKDWYYDQNTGVVNGIMWWTDHNHIKHDRNHNFEMANLSNSIDAMASLMVLELYISQQTLGNIRLISSIGCDYFESVYQPAYMVLNTGNMLPDFVGVNSMDLGELLRVNMDKGNPQINLMKSGEVKKLENKGEIVNGDIYLEYE